MQIWHRLLARFDTVRLGNLVSMNASLWAIADGCVGTIEWPEWVAGIDEVFTDGTRGCTIRKLRQIGGCAKVQRKL